MHDMGMTDKQFNLFLRFLQNSLKEIQEETTVAEKDKRIEKLLEDIQKSIED